MLVLAFNIMVGIFMFRVLLSFVQAMNKKPETMSAELPCMIEIGKFGADEVDFKGLEKGVGKIASLRVLKNRIKELQIQITKVENSGVRFKLEKILERYVQEQKRIRREVLTEEYIYWEELQK